MSPDLGKDGENHLCRFSLALEVLQGEAATQGMSVQVTSLKLQLHTPPAMHFVAHPSLLDGVLLEQRVQPKLEEQVQGYSFL